MNKFIKYPITLLSLSFVFVGCKNSNNSNIEKDKIPVVTLPLTSTQVSQKYIADIQAVQYVEIHPKVDGFVDQIYVDEGATVTKGQILFKLSSQEYEEKIKQAQASLKESQANYKRVEYEVARVKRIVAENIVSSIRLDQAQAELEAAGMKVKQSQAELQQAQTFLSYTTITAPFDGMVDRIPYKKGSLVTPESILTMVTDISEVFVYFNFNETEYLKYRRHILGGKQFNEFNEVKLILPDGSTYPEIGIVESVGADFERQTGSISFRARFKNPDKLLKHGGTGQISMLSQMDSIYLIPQQSTFEIQDFTYIYTVDSLGKVDITNFSPIARKGPFYITDDLPPNTTIVYEGIQMIKEGMQIHPDTISFEDIINNKNNITDSITN